MFWAWECVARLPHAPLESLSRTGKGCMCREIHQAHICAHAWVAAGKTEHENGPLRFLSRRAEFIWPGGLGILLTRQQSLSLPLYRSAGSCLVLVHACAATRA